ncbi:MAG: tetratricopeptide repeat protein [Candidatus Latescibacterota bacterium]
MKLRQVAAAIGATLLLGGGLFALGCQSSALTSGKLYMKQKKYDKARVQLELAVEVEPGNAEAHYNLGRICGLQGDYVDLAAAYDRAQELSPDFDEEIAKERLHYWKRSFNDGVRAQAGQGADLGTARRHFDTALRVLPDSLQAWRSRAFVDYQLGDMDAALAGYGHVLELAPEDTTTAHVMGVIYLGEERYDEAVASFEHVLNYGEHRGALVHLAKTQKQWGQNDAAVASLQRALVLDPACFRCHHMLGNLYYSSDAHEQAVESYRSAVELRADDVDVRYNLAITHRAMGDLDAAQLLLETLSVDDPDNVDVRYNLAIIHLDMGDLDAAQPLLETLSVDDPGNGKVWYKLGRIYALQARIPESEAAYERAEALGQ